MLSSGLMVGKDRHCHYITRHLDVVYTPHQRTLCCRHRTPGFCYDDESFIAVNVSTALGDSASETWIW